MPKIKTRKSFAKRFKVTGTGKILRGRQYAGHRRFHKSKRRIRTFHRNKQLNTKQTKLIKSLIGL